MLNMKKLITKMIQSDFIVEEGISGNWNYRKWNSGLLEQWYIGNPGSYTVGTARGSLYSGGTITYTYPIEFVGQYPAVVANAMLGTSAWVVWAQASGLALNTVDVRIVSSGSISANPNFTVHIYAVGRWK